MEELLDHGSPVLRKKELYYTFYQGEKLTDKTLYDIPHQVFFSLTVPGTSAVHGSVRYHFGEFIDYADAYVGKWWSVHIDLTARQEPSSGWVEDFLKSGISTRLESSNKYGGSISTGWATTSRTESEAGL